MNVYSPSEVPRAVRTLRDQATALRVDRRWHTSLIEHDTILDAALATFDRLGVPAHMAPFYVTRGHDIGATQVAAFAVRLDSGLLGSCSVTADEVLRWNQTPRANRERWPDQVGPGQQEPEPVRDLSLIVRQAVSGWMFEQGALAQFPSDLSTPRRRAEWGAAISLWWVSRLAEGHTPETASVLLGLCVPPVVMKDLTFDASGSPRLARQPIRINAPVKARDASEKTQIDPRKLLDALYAL